MPLLLNDGQVSYIYGPGGLPIAQISAEGTPSYYHHDQGGSTRMLTNSAGEAVGSFSYGPYGGLEASSGATTTSMGYAGQYTTTGSALQYLRARYYDPATEQFLSKDPLMGLTREPYAYGAGNPLLFGDPSGMGPCILGVAFCDESDDPCDSPATTAVLMPLCLIPQDAGQTVTNVSAGAGDSILSPVPFVDLPLNGPAVRDFFGIDNVEECSFLYRSSNTAADFISLGKGASKLAKHAPGVLRDASKKLDEKFVPLPPDVPQP